MTSVTGVSGFEEEMTVERGIEFRKELEGYLRGQIRGATYTLERKVLNNGRAKVYVELHLEVE